MRKRDSSLEKLSLRGGKYSPRVKESAEEQGEESHV